MNSTLSEKLERQQAIATRDDRALLGTLLRAKRTQACESELLAVCARLGVGPSEVQLLELAVAEHARLVAVGERLDERRRAAAENDAELTRLSRQQHEAFAATAQKIYDSQERRSRLVAAVSASSAAQHAADSLRILFPELGLECPETFPSAARLHDSSQIPASIYNAASAIDPDLLSRRGLPG